MVVMKGLDVACVVIYLKACHVFCIDDCPVLVLFCSGLCLFAVLVECPVWSNQGGNATSQVKWVFVFTAP